MKRKLLGLCALLYVVPAFAGLQEGVAAYDKGDLDTAIAELTPVASPDSPEAAVLLGDSYLRRRDWDQAAKWYLVAAQNGDEKIQYDMGVRIGDYISYPLGVLNDPRAKRYLLSAADCYRKAADRGYAPAQNDLGLLYEEGLKRPLDFKHSAPLYRAAALQGYAPGLANMGLAYEKAQGVKQNLFTAYMLYQMAIRYAGHDEHIEDAAVSAADHIELDLSKRDVMRAKAIAAAWKPGQPLIGVK